MLDTSYNQLGPVGTGTIVRALALLNSLHTLNIGGNHIGDDDIVAIAGALATLNGLQTLDISENNIGVEGVVAIAGALATLNSSQTLNISYNNIDRAGQRVIVDAVFSMPRLTLINRDGDPITLKLFELRRKIFASGIPQSVGAFNGVNLELQIELLDVIYRRQAGLGNTLPGQAAGDANPLNRERTRFTVCCDCGVLFV